MRCILLALACGCSRETPSSRSHAPASSASIASIPVAAVFPSSTPSAATNTPPVAQDLVLRQLRTAPIATLSVASWSHPGVFNATLQRSASETPVHVTMSLALDQHPVAHRRPLAFAEMARALGMSVVPPTTLRHVSTDELGALFAQDVDVRGYLTAHAIIQNDGTIDALMTAPSRGDGSQAWRLISRREIVLEEAPEVRGWAQALASTEPAPGENTSLLRDYVDALVLDYLAGNIKRRSVLLDEAGTELMLTENDGAFPIKIVPHAEAHLLDRLKPVVRFPRALRDVLTKFDRRRAQEVLMPGTFETWLLSPRTLMLIDERRLSLLSLIASRIEEYGERAVLSL